MVTSIDAPSPIQLEAKTVAMWGKNKGLSDEEAAEELKKLVSNTPVPSCHVTHIFMFSFQMSRHLSIQRQIHDFSTVFGPFIFLSVGLVCVLSVLLFYGMIRQGSRWRWWREVL